jgi:hypothetical protein
LEEKKSRKMEADLGGLFLFSKREEKSNWMTAERRGVIFGAVKII